MESSLEPPSMLPSSKPRHASIRGRLQNSATTGNVHRVENCIIDHGQQLRRLPPLAIAVNAVRPSWRPAGHHPGAITTLYGKGSRGDLQKGKNLQRLGKSLSNSRKCVRVCARLRSAHVAMRVRVCVIVCLNVSARAIVLVESSLYPSMSH